MALTSGFFNGKNQDRKYDAVQLSHIFDGIINDGVYQSVGNIFHVAASSGMTVTVDTGRAWFNHTWTLNDALLVLTIPTAEQVLKRIDAVVLEVNSTETVRDNSIKILKGTPASTPAKPTMTNTDDVHQYPLAYITVDANVTEISQTKIQNAVGTSVCPFVTGIIDTVDIDTLITQWSSEFNILFAELKERIEQAASQTIIDGSVTTAKLAGSAVTAPKIADNAVSSVYTATLNTTWSGSAAPYTKAQTISGILASDKPIIDLVPSATFADAEAQEEAWANVYRAVTSANTITFYAKEKPTVSIPIQVRCIRK